MGLSEGTHNRQVTRVSLGMALLTRVEFNNDYLSPLGCPPWAPGPIGITRSHCITRPVGPRSAPSTCDRRGREGQSP